jgi:hypothetical protein
MNVYFGSGKPQGVGISGGEGPDGQMRECEGQFMSNLRSRWTIPVTATVGGFQVSRRGYKGGEKGNWQGEVKARGMRHV